MAVVFSETFDGATSGTLNPPGWTPLGGYGQYSTAQKVNGSAAYFSGTSQAYLQRSTGATQNKRFIRLYFRRETVSTDANNCSFAVLYDTAGSPNAVARLGFVSNTGNLMVRDGGTIAAQYPTTTGQWYRADWSAEVGIGQRVRLYTGAALHSANTADAVAGGTLLALTGAFTWGAFNIGLFFAVSPACNFYIDEVAVDNAALPAPFAPPATGRPKVWTGSTWTKKPAKVWTGSAWVEKPVKAWTGATWKQVT